MTTGKTVRLGHTVECIAHFAVPCICGYDDYLISQRRCVDPVCPLHAPPVLALHGESEPETPVIKGFAPEPNMTCAHCGRPMNDYAGGFGMSQGKPLCHPNEQGRPDCFRLVTVYHEPIGAQLPVPEDEPTDVAV